MQDWDKLLAMRCDIEVGGDHEVYSQLDRYIHVGVKSSFRALTNKWLPPLCPDMHCFDLHASMMSSREP